MVGIPCHEDRKNVSYTLEHCWTKFWLSQPLPVHHFFLLFSFLSAFITRSKKTNIRSLTNYTLKMRFLVKRRDLCLKGSNIPDGEGKQGDMQLMRGIISVTMQEMKLSSKNGSPQRGERKLPKSEKKKIQNVQGYFKKRITSRNISWDRQCQFTLLLAGSQLHHYTSTEKVESTEERRIWCLPCSCLMMVFFSSWVVFQFNVSKFSICNLSLEKWQFIHTKTCRREHMCSQARIDFLF